MKVILPGRLHSAAKQSRQIDRDSGSFRYSAIIERFRSTHRTMENSNPYQSPEIASVPRTIRNFTPVQCLFGFLVVGCLSGLTGGVAATAANDLGAK